MRLIDADELSKWISGQSKSPSCPKNESAFGLRIIKHIDRMPSVQPDVPDTNVGDLISRQVAIDICHKNYDGILDFRSDGRTVALSFEDIINSVPSVQPEPQWIPCSERLPEVGAFVLVSKKAFPPNVCMAHRSRDPRSGKEAWNDMLFGKLDDDRVLAWMPLPEPYQEEGE